MKIAVIAPTEIPARRANSMQVMKMAQALVVLGHQVRLVAPGKTLKADQDTSDPDNHGLKTKGDSRSVQEATWTRLSQHYGIEHRFPVEWLPAASKLRRYDYGLRAVQWARDWKAELIYTRLPQSAAIASTIGLATILETHDLPQGRFGAWVFLRFVKGRGGRRLVLITRALATDISRQLKINCSLPFTVIAPDGVDLERYAHLSEPVSARLTLNQENSAFRINNIPVDRFTVGYTGHLYKGRGLEILLELAARMPEFTFLIVGGEPQDVSYLQGIVNSRNLENILLTGFIPNSELAHYQAACDVLVMPYQLRVSASSGGDISRYLSPMKLFEYLACERAIVSSNLPVLQEVLNTRNAILLSGEEIDSWTEAIRKLHSNPELRMKLAKQARQDASLYTWESRATHILEGLENDPTSPRRT
jgi:glycosyltransferase involved in cell wall biosynthesis